MRVALTHVQRGAITKYAADIEVDGVRVGYAQKSRYSERYEAFAQGLRIGSARTIVDLKEEIRAHFENEAAKKQ